MKNLNLHFFPRHEWFSRNKEGMESWLWLFLCWCNRGTTQYPLHLCLRSSRCPGCLDTLSVFFLSLKNKSLDFLLDNSMMRGMILPFSIKQTNFEAKLICLEGKSMPPHLVNTIHFSSFQQLPRLRLGQLKSFLSWRSTLKGPSTRLLRFFWNNRDTKTPSGVLHQVLRLQDTIKNNCGQLLCACWKCTCFKCSNNWDNL